MHIAFHIFAEIGSLMRNGVFRDCNIRYIPRYVQPHRSRYRINGGVQALLLSCGKKIRHKHYLVGSFSTCAIEKR
jgi:hypothetical protein